MGLGDDGGGGSRGGRPRPHARGRARSAPRRHRRRDLPPGLRRGGEHHALVLPPPPLRPAAPAALRPPLAAGVGGLPGLQPGHGRRGGGAGGRGRRRLRAGLPLLAAGAHAGRGAARSAHGALPTHALRRARHARGAARRRAGGAARRHGGLLGLWLPLPPVGGCVLGLLRRGRASGWRGRGRAADVRGAARPRRRPARVRVGVARLRGGGGCPARRSGRAAHHCPDRPHGAFEEHRAGDARLRGTADRVPRVAGQGGARCFCVSQPAGAGRVSRLRGRCGAHGGAHQPCLRDGRMDAHCAVTRGRPGPLARRPDALRRPAGQPGARRAQPRRQGGAAAQRGRRCARPVPPGRGVGGARIGRWRRAGRQPLRCGGDGRRAAGRAHHGRSGAAARAAALRAAVRGRTAADWWADQLAAAQR